MELVEFFIKFSDEDNCKSFYRDIRQKEGVICKKCKCEKHYWLQSLWQFKCSSCGFRTTLKSGTVMENSRLSFKKWFLIMYLMSATKKGFSACELQRQVGHKRYQTIWTIMHRLREAMGKRDKKYQLKGMVEFDEGYFTVETSKKDNESLTRGRGSERKQNVAVMSESTYLEDIETGKVSKQCRFFKMKALSTHKSEEIDQTVASSINQDTVLFSDKSTSYVNMDNIVEAHIMEKSSTETTVDSLKWVHIAISNAKRNFLGVYHKIKGKYLQNYLDEFVYRLNRRYFKTLFIRLLVASTLI
jgi:transposase-like protein